MLVADFGYVRAAERPRRKKGNTGTSTAYDGAADWQYLVDRIRAGEALHDSLRDLAAKLVTSGMAAGAAVNFLRALMESSSAPRDERWLDRLNEIPRLVDSAEGLGAKADPAAERPRRVRCRGKAWPRFTRFSKNGSAPNMISMPPPPRLPPRHPSACPAIRCGC